MNSIVKIIFSLILVSIIRAQQVPFIFNAAAAEYVPIDSSCDVSLTLKISFEEYDRLELFTLTDYDVIINSAMLVDETGSIPVSFEKIPDEKYYGNSYKISFSEKDSIITVDSPFQLLLNFGIGEKAGTEINFTTNFYFENYLLSSISSADNFGNEGTLPKLEIEKYLPQSRAGSALLIKPGGECRISADFSNYENSRVIEFWEQPGEYKGRFFSLINPQTDDTIYRFVIDKFQMLRIFNSSDNDFYEESFLGKTGWYHFLLALDPISKESGVYVNGKIVFSSPYCPIPFEKLKICFDNLDDSVPFAIENLRAWDVNGSPNAIIKNKHYVSFSADSISAVLNFNFDSEIKSETDPETGEKKISNSKSKIIESSAPIFSRTPKLSVYIYEEFYTLEWFNTEIADAKYFELEKSLDGKTFNTISNQEIDGDPERLYFFSDIKNANVNIVYYRVKQMNKDGKAIYSSSLKIGLGESQKFVLGQNYPNPFNPITTISLELFESIEVDVTVFNLVGKEVEKLHIGALSAGLHTFEFDGSNLPSGIYFLETKSPYATQVIKMILAK